MSATAARSYRWLLWALAIGGTLLDQATKYGVFRWLYASRQAVSADYDAGDHDVIPGVFKFLAQYTHTLAADSDGLAMLRTFSSESLPKVNHGALFGLGAEYARYANATFALVSIVAAIAIIVWSCKRATAGDLPLCAALGLILAGTLGNLYDRLIFHGVRDFLYFYLINWPVFNLADCCLVCGAGLLLAQAFWGHSTTSGTAVPEQQAVVPNAPARA